MMNNYSDEIAQLRREMEDLKALFTQFVGSAGAAEVVTTTATKQTAQTEKLPQRTVQTMQNMHPDARLSGLMIELCELSERERRTGSVTYLGVFASGGLQSNWIQNAVNADDLLALIDNKSAATVLQCIGNNDRLTLLLALLRTPMTVAAMVENCGFNSTGQVYHHLKPLLAADLVCEVEQAERGVYAVKHHRVQGIIMLLAGVSDLMDTRFSQGHWAAQS